MGTWPLASARGNDTTVHRGANAKSSLLPGGHAAHPISRLLAYIRRPGQEGPLEGTGHHLRSPSSTISETRPCLVRSPNPLGKKRLYCYWAANILLLLAGPRTLCVCHRALQKPPLIGAS